MQEWCAYISLESISEWARQSNDRYDAFVAAICEEAVAKRDAQVREKSPEATAFWEAYRRLASQLLPEVDITRLPLWSAWRHPGLASELRHYRLMCCWSTSRSKGAST
jgi:hypothetical protein